MKWLASVLAVAVIVVGCSGSSSTPAAGPLDFGAESGGLCTPAAPGAHLTVANDVLRNTGSRPVVVRSVRLAGSAGLRLGQTFVVPLDGHTMVGVGGSFPPTLDGQAEANWQHRAASSGATVPARSELGLVAEVWATGRSGHADGFVVDYTVGGKRYRYTTPVKIRLAGSCG